jgi:hypothetical protein
VPIEIAPNRIDLTQLDGGFQPDTPESAVPLNASPDMTNLLLEHGGSSPETRKGFERLVAGQSSLTAHTVRSLFFYECINDGTRLRHLVAVMSDGTSGANNVQVWAYDLINDTFERVDDPGRVWEQPNSPHWGIVVGNKFYGGVRGDAIYEWHPITGWVDDPTANQDLVTWVDDINDDVDTATEIARDYAYRKGRKVVFEDEEYATVKGIRYAKWNSDEAYKKGDRVSRRHVWGSSTTYWKSFECITSHKGDTARNAPGSGTGWRSFWKKIRLDDILDEDGDLTEDWTFAGNGIQSSVGVFYADRLHIRRDNEDSRSTVQYSAPLTTKDAEGKRRKMPELVWNPQDWAAVDTIDGEGGGWYPVMPGKGDAIRDMHEMGNYLVIAKRWTTFVLSGRSEQTWSQRKLGNLGAVALGSLTELDSLVYGLAPTGALWVTDGTDQREVPGSEKAREFIKERIDRLLETTPEDDDERWMPQVFAYDRRIWVSLPDAFDAADPDDITMVYDPLTESWWKLDLPILTATTGAADRAERLFFSTPKRSGKATLFVYGDDPGDLVFTDDDPLGGDTPLTTAIPWHYRTAWIQFGAREQDRRIRRMWALVKTAVNVTLDGYRNFITSSSAYGVTRSFDSGHGTSFIEGKHMADSHAVALKVAGTAATGGPSLVGVGVDTQPRRTRWHRN